MNRSHGILLALILLFTASFRLAVLNRPFERDPEGCGAFYGLIARNCFRYPWSEHIGLPVISMGEGGSMVYYANHPPTTGLLIAGVHLLTGYRGGYDSLPGDWQTRLPSAVFTVGCAALMYFLLRRRAGEVVALLAPALFACIPMSLYYGGQPDVISTQLVFFALLTVAAYERFADAPGWRTLGWLVLAFLGAGVMDWPAYYLIPILGLHYICTHRPKQWGWAIGFGLAGTFIFFLLYAHLAIGKGDWWWMVSQVERRTGGETDAAQRFSLVQWFQHAVIEIGVKRHTWVVSGLALIGVVVAAIRRPLHPGTRFVGLVLAWGVLHVLIGRQGVYQHEWWWWPMTPGLVMAAAIGIEWIVSAAIKPRVAYGIVGVLIASAAGVNSYRTIREMNSPNRINKGGIEFSLAELGDVIRESAPPDRAVVLAESDISLGIWYYADRALKRHVWDPATLESRIADQQVELSFDAKGQFPHPAAAMVVPKSYLAELGTLVQHLDARYPKRDLEKFLVYDLTTPRPIP